MEEKTELEMEVNGVKNKQSRYGKTGKGQNPQEEKTKRNYEGLQRNNGKGNRTGYIDFGT